MRTIAHPPNSIIGKPSKLRAWCIYQLALRESSLATLASALGVSRTVAYSTFHKRNYRMETAIANALDLEVHELWPGRYDEHGVPIKHWKKAS